VALDLTLDKESTKLKTKQMLKINLDEVKNPHPKIKKVWQESGVQDDYPPYADKANWNNEKRLFILGKSSTASSPARKIHHKITSIYRKISGNKEYCFFFEHLWTKDLLGNYIDHTRELGRYEVPNIAITSAYDRNQDQSQLVLSTVSSQIVNVEMKYEWEFEQIKPQLQKWYDEGIIDENTQFTVWPRCTRKYTVNSWDEFINLSLQDLTLIGRVGPVAQGLGFNTPESILAKAKEVAKEEMDKILKKDASPFHKGTKLQKIE
jgi:hypothetical protein